MFASGEAPTRFDCNLRAISSRNELILRGLIAMGHGQMDCPKRTYWGIGVSVDGKMIDSPDKESNGILFVYPWF